MPGYLLAAAIVMLLTGLAHSVLGELLILRHMGSFQGMPALLGSVELARRTLRFTWHLPTVLATAMALMLIRAAGLAQPGQGERFVVQTIAGSMLACALVTALISRGRHPGWAAFLVAAFLAWMGAR
jgi:hypothetical protein